MTVLYVHPTWLRGSEEAFAGYQRHARACDAGDEATSRDRTLGLAQMWHRDLQRDFAVAALAKVEISDLAATFKGYTVYNILEYNII